MLGKRIINSNNAAAGGACTTNNNDYPTTNVAYYKMSTAADEKGTYNGTASNVNFNVQGKYGNAAEFNGSSSFISLPTGVDKNNNFTLSFWVNFNTLSDYDSLITLQLNYRIYTNAMSDGRLFFYDGNTTLSTSAGVVATGNWYNIVVTKSSTLVNGKGMIIYVNGVDVANNSVTDNAINNTSAGLNLLGAYNSSPGGNYFYLDGKLDQVRIFNSALDSTQVASLYNEVYCVPTIVPSESFNTVLYTGNNSTQSITGVGFQPDFTWIKARNNGSNNHALTDSVRGTGSGNGLSSNTTGAEGQYSAAYGYLSAFGTDGFTVQAGSTSPNFVNSSSANYVAWNWKAGGASVSNTDGTITSQVSADVDAGFSIVSYTGASGTVGHGLDSTPEIIIQKKTNGSEDWYVYFPPGVIDSNYNYMVLNSAASKGTTGSTPPTTTTFNPVSSSGNYIAYAFHSVDGFSKIGSYTGNGSATGSTVVTGFRPAFVLIKATTTDNGGGNWIIYDNKRSTTNPRDKRLYADLNIAEQTNSNYDLDFLSNGFKPKNGANYYGFNTSNVDYIFMAIAEEALPTVTRNATNPFGDSSEVALYKFEDDATDAEGNYDGNASNVTYASGYIDKAAVFNGSNSSILATSPTQGNTDASYSFWIKTPTILSYVGSQPSYPVFGQVSDASRNPFSIYWYASTTSGKMTFTMWRCFNNEIWYAQGYLTDFDFTYVANTWYHIVITYTASNKSCKNYVNGNQIGGAPTLSLLASGQSTGTQMKLGSYNNNQGIPFNGSIDQVRIFNRTLDSGEVTALYNE